MSDRPKVPKELDAIADVVLAYKPKPKSKPAKKRKKMANKLSKIAKPAPESHRVK
jgi:hypothetical protein